MNTDFDKLELLLQTKSFDELNVFEQDLVIKSLTNEEYNALHDLYTLAPSRGVDEIEPSSGLKSRLDDALKAKKTPHAIAASANPVVPDCCRGCNSFLYRTEHQFIVRNSHKSNTRFDKNSAIYRPSRDANSIRNGFPRNRCKKTLRQTETYIDTSLCNERGQHA